MLHPRKTLPPPKLPSDHITKLCRGDWVIKRSSSSNLVQHQRPLQKVVLSETCINDMNNESVFTRSNVPSQVHSSFSSSFNFLQKLLLRKLAMEDKNLSVY